MGLGEGGITAGKTAAAWTLLDDNVSGDNFPFESAPMWVIASRLTTVPARSFLLVLKDVGGGVCGSGMREIWLPPPGIVCEVVVGIGFELANS